jgi:HSP20 family molecular chaperone IbpA
MGALVPRLWNDLADWLDMDLVQRTGMIRIEDHVTDTEYTVRAELPGMDLDNDVQINVANGVLTIHAERKEQTQSGNHTEFRYGMMQRSLRLPPNADEENAKARYSKGILEITVPLKAIPAGRRVEITADAERTWSSDRV